MYRFREFYIPVRMMPGIKRYIEQHIRPGDFLIQIICNNLREACGKADDENMCNLPAYVAYFYNEAPSSCWGSEKNFKNWIKGRKNENHS